MNGLTLAEVEGWRALVAAGRAAIAAPTVSMVQRLGARAGEALKLRIPPPRDPIRERTFWQLCKVSAGYGPGRAGELENLIGICAPVIEDAAAALDRALDR